MKYAAADAAVVQLNGNRARPVMVVGILDTIAEKIHVVVLTWRIIILERSSVDD